MEFLLGIIGDLLFSIATEAIFETLFRGLGRLLGNGSVTVLSAVGYFLFGLFIGTLTLIPLPHHFIHNRVLRVINLVVTPTASGGAMFFVGKFRVGRGETLTGLDYFWNAFAFALGMAAVRFTFAS